MAKYHINNEGKVYLCRARNGGCPYGNEVHFDTKEEALEYADQLYEDQYGLMADDVTKRLDYVLSDENSLTNRVLNATKVKTRGFQYECFAAERLADEMGLDQVTVLNDEGIVSIEGDGDFVNQMQAMKIAMDSLISYYGKHGIPIDDAESLVRVIYYSNDSDKILVQSGGPNVLDAAVIEANEVVDMIEVKKLHEGGAQMSSEILETDAAGSINPDELKRYPEYLQKALRRKKMRDVNGKNDKLRLTNVEALTHFVDQYKAKNAKTFIYISESGQLITEDLTRSTDEIVERLNAKGVKAEVRLRGNYGKQKVTQTQVDRFDFYVGHFYFKDGQVPFTDTFKVKDLNPDEMSESSGYVRLGEFVLPIKTKDLKKLPDDYEISKWDMEYFPMTLTGTITV